METRVTPSSIIAPMIYLIRHGQTQFNVEGRYQGACDSPLTTRGEEQAHHVGAVLRRCLGKTAFITLWSSPLGRAIHTAEIVREELNIKATAVIDERLREVTFGSWDGLTTIDIEHLYPDACDGASAFDWYFRSPDGESADQVERRLTPWLAEVALLPGCHVAVSHLLVGRLLRGLYANLPRPEALMLDGPQDAIFRLHAGSIDRIDAGAI